MILAAGAVFGQRAQNGRGWTGWLAGLSLRKAGYSVPEDSVRFGLRSAVLWDRSQ